MFSQEDQLRIEALNDKRAKLLSERVAALKEELAGQLSDNTTTVGEALPPEQIADALHRHGLSLGPMGNPC